ncbi:MAG TPA: hypothetical protein VF575_02670 [Candidatus Saccharimonadales bacterium]
MERSRSINTPHNRATTRRTLSALTLAATSLAFATGCGGSDAADKFMQQSHPVEISRGEIPAGTNIRHTPRAYDRNDNGASNLCTTLDESIKFLPMKNALQNPGDFNGPFIGFNGDSLSPWLANKCADPNGIVWVAKSQLHEARVTPLPYDRVPGSENS